MPRRFVQCRVDDETGARVDAAAAEWDMAVGTWLRAVLEAALEAQEAVELVESRSEPGTFHKVNRVLGTCDCLGFENAGHCWHLDGDSGIGNRESGIPDGYLEQVEAAATELRETDPLEVQRVEHPDASIEEPKEEPSLLEQRDCPHHPAWRTAGRCARCGTRVGRGVMLGR